MQAMGNKITIKVCSLCHRVHRYAKGNTLPHWGDLSITERCELSRLDIRRHHTICPDCRERIRERDTRLRTIDYELRTPPKEAP